MQPKSPTGPRAVRGDQGFTAIELLVVVAILGILVALATPSFQTLIQNWRIRQVADDFASSFMLARSEALRRGGGIVVRRNPADASACPGVDASSADDWSCGWFVFVDTDADGLLDAGEQTLRIARVPRSLQFKRSAEARFFRIDQWGQAGGMGGLGFSVQPRPGEAGTPVAVCVGSAGRIDIRKGTRTC